MSKKFKNVLLVGVAIISILLVNGLYNFLFNRETGKDSQKNKQQAISNRDSIPAENSMQKTKTMEKELTEFSDSENKTLPDGEIYRVSASGKELTIFLKMQGVPVISQKWVDEVARKTFIENVACPDPQMRHFLEEGALITYDVSNVDGNQNGKTTVILSDCK